MATAMKGIIALWSGTEATIPFGWAMCNGLNGTPDLRDKFIIGAGPAKPPGTTGGASSHTHVFSGTPAGHTHVFTPTSHAHDLISGYNIAAGGDIYHVTSTSLAPGTNASTNVTPAGTIPVGATVPPYYALCYIMHI